MMPKQLLTPQQIAEKFIKPTNPFCGTEKRAVADIRKDLVEYIELVYHDAFMLGKKAGEMAAVDTVSPY